MLVVVVIIGIVIVGAVLSLGALGKDNQMQQERDRLAALISYARERAGILTLEYGIRCGPHGYRFVMYDNRTMRWIPETVDDTLRVRKLPAGLTLQLVIEGRTVALEDKALQFNASAAKVSGYPGSSDSSGAAPSLSGAANSFASSRGLGASTALGGSFGNRFGAAANDTSRGTGASGTGNATGGSGNGLGNAGDDNTPQILLFSNGDINSFALTLARDGTARTVTMQSAADGSGTVQVGEIVEPTR